MSSGPSSTHAVPNLPFDLRQAIESGDCVLFVGGGIGGSLFDKDGKPLPYASKLATEMADFFGIDAEGSTDLTKISQLVEIRKRGTGWRTIATGLDAESNYRLDARITLPADLPFGTYDLRVRGDGVSALEPDGLVVAVRHG